MALGSAGIMAGNRVIATSAEQNLEIKGVDAKKRICRLWGRNRGWAGMLARSERRLLTRWSWSAIGSRSFATERARMPTEQKISGERLFIFAGGGTGGHLYPGLAIAEQLWAQMGERCSCLFLCSTRAIDRRVLEAARHGGADEAGGAGGQPIKFEPIAAQPLSVRPLALLRFLRAWGPSIRSTRVAIATARARGASVHVVAMGGFVAAPAVQAAIAERVPVTLVNLDAVPGKANRWIAGRIRGGKVFTAAMVDDPIAREWVTVPPIVRAGARAKCSAAEARAALGLAEQGPTLMVTGGSQGAGSVNRFLAGFAKSEHAHSKPAHSKPEAPLRGWQVLHQSGDEDNRELAAAYEQAGATKVVVTKFVDQMGLWWRAADLAVSRCGAGSVAEAWASGCPSLFLPYPFHKDEHQRKNAVVLERAGGAVVVTDLVDPARNLAANASVLMGLLGDEARRTAMRRAIEGLGPVDGAARVARALARTS